MTNIPVPITATVVKPSNHKFAQRLWSCVRSQKQPQLCTDLMSSGFKRNARANGNYYIMRICGDEWGCIGIFLPIMEDHMEKKMAMNGKLKYT